MCESCKVEFTPGGAVCVPQDIAICHMERYFYPKKGGMNWFKKGLITMVKRIKKAQKGLVLTTSPRSYWFNSCIHTRRSVRGGGGYTSCSGVTFLTFLNFQIMPKRLKRPDFSLCE